MIGQSGDKMITAAVVNNDFCKCLRSNLLFFFPIKDSRYEEKRNIRIAHLF